MPCWRGELGMSMNDVSSAFPATSAAVALTTADCGGDSNTGVEVSVVIPCLNEAETLARCIETAQVAMRAHGISGEVIVADNRSTDASAEIARSLGARVVDVVDRGYGRALMGGITAATGEYVIMGDADASYDFAEIPRFVRMLREGYDLVQGCRLPSGNGRIMPGAMPFLHRWLGNPMFSALARLFFGSPVSDIYCGLRGFRRAWQLRLGQRCAGMEFANEMIIKGSWQRSRIGEIPITLHVDGRQAHPPHLRTFRDGWRTLRFYLLHSPRWLFAYPGAMLLVLAAIGYAVAMPGWRVAGVHFDLGTLVAATLAGLIGYQAIIFAIVAQAIGVAQGSLPCDELLPARVGPSGLEQRLLFGGVLTGIGGALLSAAVFQWWLAGFGDLRYEIVLRLVIPATMLMGLGVQTIFASFVLALLDSETKWSTIAGTRRDARDPDTRLAASGPDVAG
jgi:hypothetical protein